MNSTSDLLESLFNQSLTSMLDKAFMVNVYLPTAPIGLFANLLIILTIWRTKEIHNKSHFIILSYTIADALYEFLMIIWEIRLAIRVQQRNPIVVASWLCILNYQQIGIVSQASAILSAALAVDRFMCVAWPIFYKKIDTRKYILAVNVTVYSYVIAMVFIGMIGTDIYLVWNCEGAQYQYNIIGQTQYDKISTIVAVIIGVLYTSAASVLAYRYKTASLAGSIEKAEWKKRWELQVFASMSVVGVIAVVMRTIHGVTFTIAQQHIPGMSVSGEFLVSFSVVARFTEAVLHFFIYMAVDSGFRAGFRAVVLDKVLRRNVVTALSGSTARSGVSVGAKATEVVKANHW